MNENRIFQDFDDQFGHSGNAALVFADRELSREDAVALAKMEDDQAISRADAAIRQQLASLMERTKRAIGNVVANVSREIYLQDRSDHHPLAESADDQPDDLGARAKSRWSVIIYDATSNVACGIGEDADAALANVVGKIDAKYGIKSTTAGFVAPGVAHVQAFPHRVPSEALALARRFALDQAYLAAALEFGVPGISDLRVEEESPKAA